jgi:hypothetical protein
MIRSSDLLIFFEKTNFSSRFSIRYFINSSHHLNFYHCIALSIYLSTDNCHRECLDLIVDVDVVREYDQMTALLHDLIVNDYCDLCRACDDDD